MMKQLLAATLLLTVAVGHVWGQDDAKKKPKEKKAAKGMPAKLLGVWNYASGVRGGEKVAKERLVGDVTFKKDEVTLPGGPNVMFVMGYKIDTTKKPATIDLKIKDGPVKEGNALGIIKMEKGQVTLCYHPGGSRPSKFESTEENGAFLFVLKRKSSFDISKLPGTWTYVSGTRAGEKVEAARLAGEVTFSKDKVVIPAGPDAKFVMAFKIDGSKSPATIDIEIKEGPVSEGQALGLIKLEGGKLTLCYDPQGGARPKAFKSTADNGAFRFELKKKQD